MFYNKYLVRKLLYITFFISVSLLLCASPQPSIAIPNSINWHTCPDIKTPDASKFYCGTISVPVDYKKPDAKQIKLSVIKRETNLSNKNGVLFINFGGPWGQDVTQLPFFTQDAYKGLINNFDIISFNPRGTGANAVACNSPYDSSIIKLNLDSDASVKKLIDLTHKKVAFCSKQYEELADQNLATTVTVQDLEQIRRALNIDKISFIGYSYGTLLGALYLQNYPEHVRAMVLDGNMSPSNDYQHLLKTFATGLENVTKHFFTECSNYNTDSNAYCRSYRNKGGYVNYFGDMFKQATLSPVPISKDPNTQLTVGIIRTLFATDLLITRHGNTQKPFYFPVNKWPKMANGIKQIYQDNEGDILLDSIENPVVPDMKTQDDGPLEDAVRCIDYQNHYTDNQIIKIAKTMREKYPVIGGWFFANYAAQCIGWKSTKKTHFPTIEIKNNTVPVLIIGSKYDPGTVFEFSQEMHRAISNSYLLIWNGSGHTTYMANELPGYCIADKVNAYLVGLKLPDSRTVTCSDYTHPFK
jgi:pimeloyl-ACP methyl ester carboxylesterase